MTHLEQAANLNNEFITSAFFKGEGRVCLPLHSQKRKENKNNSSSLLLYRTIQCHDELSSGIWPAKLQYLSILLCILLFRLTQFFTLFLTQVLALAYYTISYFPGGSSGLKFISSGLLSSATSLFGRWPSAVTHLLDHTMLCRKIFVCSCWSSPW